MRMKNFHMGFGKYHDPNNSYNLQEYNYTERQESTRKMPAIFLFKFHTELLSFQSSSSLSLINSPEQELCPSSPSVTYTIVSLFVSCLIRIWAYTASLQSLSHFWICCCLFSNNFWILGFVRSPYFWILNSTKSFTGWETMIPLEAIKRA